MMVPHCSHFLIYIIHDSCSDSWIALKFTIVKSLKLHMCIILFLELLKIDDSDDRKLTSAFWQIYIGPKPKEIFKMHNVSIFK
jgi:hypothetical protein